MIDEIANGMEQTRPLNSYSERRRSSMLPAKRRFLLPVAVSVLSALIVNAQDPPKSQPFPDLVAGLKATQGCLGVETARTSSGKNVIFAWFEDKKAALRWYTSKMHMQVM